MPQPLKSGRTVLAAVAAAGTLVLLSACSGTTQPADAGGGGGTAGGGGGASKTIAFSPLCLQIPAMQDLSKGVQGYSGSKGYQVIVQDPALDPQKQLTDLQSIIESGRVGGAWVIAIQPSALSALVKTAQAKQVPLLLNGTPEDFGLSGMQAGITFDKIDYEAQGKAIGTELGNCINEKLGGKANVLFEANNPGTAGKEALESNAQAALAATAPNAKIVATITVNDRAKAQTDVGNALQGNPDLNAVLGNNDEGALGALGAFDAAGKKLTCSTDFGGNDEVLKGVADGKIYASVALQFQADMTQSFDTLVTMQADPKANGQVLIVPQKIVTQGS